MTGSLASTGEHWQDQRVIPDDEPMTLADRLARDPNLGAALADQEYNATITVFDRLTTELWILRIKPDDSPISFKPGQYANLALGMWEPRVDDAMDADADARWNKLIRRSYSISSPIFDDNGALARCTDLDDIELYVVLVAPEDDFVPGLTPRLALKAPGDRIFMGRKMAGRYTTAALTDPTHNAVFLSTGTGEAPQNAMITELLRTGHTGTILSVVTVRQWDDLAYLDKNRKLEKMFPNFHYVPMPTREPDVPKRYIQDVIQHDFTPDKLGIDLDPADTHVFLCGNPSMIGLPVKSDDGSHFPESTGVVELLTKLGFVLDERKKPGTIHVEEYW